MSYSHSRPPLGAVLQQAGLVSAEQVEQALKQQKLSNSSLKIGEILAIQGRIDPQTANFFSERWYVAVSEQPKQPIGQYLKQAALLNDRQIQAILTEQKNSQLKFGELAIAKGWLRQTTLDFFLRYLRTDSDLAPVKVSKEQLPAEEAKTTVNAGKSYFPRESKNVGVEEKQDYSQKVHEGFLQIKRKLLKIEGSDTYSEKTLERVLLWTGGHSLLTQKIFTLIAQSQTPLSLQQEEEQVDYLVQTKIVDNWSNNELQLHLRGIRERMMNNQHCPPEQLLLLYQKVLMGTASIDSSPEQQELLSLGLAVKQQNKLVVANRIYQSVFNLGWVVETLNRRVGFGVDRDRLIPNGSNSSAIVATPSPANEIKDSWLNFKNLLLLLVLIGLSGILVNNISKRITVRKSFQQGNELLKQKSFSEAADEYSKLLEIDSNYFQAWTNRGYALAGLQKYEAMRESCSTASIIHPEAVYAWNCQGEALHNLEKYEEAVEAFDRAISLNQTDPIFSINKSESLRALGENKASIESVQQAIEVLEQIEAQDGSNNIKGEFAVALTLLGNSHRQAESFNKAIIAYDRAREYSPNYFPARIGKGITLSRAKRYPEAKSEFKQMLEDFQLTSTQQAQTWFYLGKTLCKSAQYADGLEAFERAIKLNPDYAIARDAKQQCR